MSILIRPNQKLKTTKVSEEYSWPQMPTGRKPPTQTQTP